MSTVVPWVRFGVVTVERQLQRAEHAVRSLELPSPDPHDGTRPLVLSLLPSHRRKSDSFGDFYDVGYRGMFYVVTAVSP